MNTRDSDSTINWNSSPGYKASWRGVKRVMDIAGALAGLVLLSPPFVLVCIAVMLETPGPPLFKQKRGGRFGAGFFIYKFRTMKIHDDAAVFIQQARRGDGRITGVGDFLRRTSIDELPQLLNVVKGEMSLVGPRPHALSHDQFYGDRISNYADRFKMRPGLTGLAQCHGLRGPIDDIADMEARVEKDLDYVRGWSFSMDVMILVRTVRVITDFPSAGRGGPKPLAPSGTPVSVASRLPTP